MFPLALPLMILPIAGYMIVAGVFALFGISLGVEILRLHLGSGGELMITPGDVLLMMGLLGLAAELWRGMSARPAAIVNSGASLALFAVCVGLLVFTPWCATATFLLLTAMTLLDTVFGFALAVALSRGNIWVDTR